MIGRLACLALAGGLAASPARGDEPAPHPRLLAEAGLGAGSGGFLAGGRLSLRPEPILLALGYEGALAPPRDRSAFLGVISLQAGLLAARGPWELEAAAFLGSHGLRYPDTIGTGPLQRWRPAVGLRLGAGRFGDLALGRLRSWLGISASLSWSGDATIRARELRPSGLAAWLLLSAGAGWAGGSVGSRDP